MNRTSISRIEAVLRVRLAGKCGDNVYVNDTDAMPYHPLAATFYCENPNSKFDGHTPSPIFATSLLRNECDDDKKYRIERTNGVLIYTRYDVSLDSGCYYATGQAIVCEPGTDAESVFLSQCFADMVEVASEPLIGLMKAARQADLKLSAGVEQKLRRDVFGD